MNTGYMYYVYVWIYVNKCILTSLSNVAMFTVYRNAKIDAEKNKHLVFFGFVSSKYKISTYFKNNCSARVFFKGCSVFQKHKGYKIQFV